MSNLDNFTIFDYLYNEYKINKPIRLIELFAGYGSQALALKYLGVKFSHWRICEWAVKSIQAYKDIHFSEDNNDYSQLCTKEQLIDYLTKKGISSNYNEPMTYEQIKRLGENQLRTIYNNIIATKNLVNISQVKAKDLDICDTENYDYIMTYSFPCQDLSLAGLQKGMEKGSSTRSGLLWEVERILEECHKLGNMPQILLMENVPQVVGSKNINDFKKWLAKLESLGYSNYCETINAKDYLIPQNRERTFMISILGEYNYNFPKGETLKLRLKDLLEENLSTSTIERISKWKAQQDPLKDIDKEKIISPCITARGAGEEHSGMVLINDNVMKIGNYSPSGHNASSIIDTNGIAPTVMENHGTVTAIIENKQGGVIIPEKTAKGYAIAHDGDGVYINRPHQKRGCVQKGMIQTLKTSPDVGVVVNNDKNLKKELCEKLIIENKVQENDVIKHSYSTSRLEEWEKRGTERNNMCPTLDTRCDCLGVVVNDNKKKDIIEYGSYYTWKDNQGNYNTQCNRAAKEDGCALTVACAETGKVAIRDDCKSCANCQNFYYDTFCGFDQPMCKIFGSLLNKDDVGSFCTYYSFRHRITYTSNLRIRKLTPREVFRLMGVKDEDFEKVAKNQSNASLYHLAGDSIVTTCLMAIFSQLFDNLDWKEKWEQ